MSEVRTESVMPFNCLSKFNDFYAEHAAFGLKRNMISHSVGMLNHRHDFVDGDYPAVSEIVIDDEIRSLLTAYFDSKLEFLESEMHGLWRTIPVDLP